MGRPRGHPRARRPRAAAAHRGVALRDPGVPVPARAAPLAPGQVGLLDRSDDRPVPANRATLESPPAEAQRLDGSSRDPDRREQVSLVAADHDVSSHAAGAKLRRDRLEKDARSHDERRTAATTLHPEREHVRRFLAATIATRLPRAARYGVDSSATAPSPGRNSSVWARAIAGGRSSRPLAYIHRP